MIAPVTATCQQCGQRFPYTHGRGHPSAKRPAQSKATLGSAGADRSRARRPKRGGDTEALLAAQLVDAGYVDVADFDDTWPLHKFHRMFVRQFAWALRCDPPRGFASDFAFIEKRLLVEVKGLAHAAGRSKVRADVEREGLAVSLGWTVLPLTPESVRDGSAVELIARALNQSARAEGG